VSLSISVPTSQIAERLVSRWFDALKARDLVGMLMLFHPGVDFYPLKLSGSVGWYRGHDGVREWWVKLQRGKRTYDIELTDVCSVGTGQIIALGSFRVASEPGEGPFRALHRINAGLIVAAHHCLTDPEMIDRLGLIP
jgi:hypothetical protein